MVRFFIRWFIRFGLLAMVALAILWVARNTIGKAVLVGKLERATGLEAQVEAVRVDMSRWRIQAQGIKLFNTREFGGDLFMDIPFVQAELRPLPLARRQLDFQLLEFHLHELNIVKNREGITNLQRLKAMDRSSSFKFVGVNALHLSLHRVRIHDLADPSKRTEFDLGVRNVVYQNVTTWGDLAPLFFKVLLRSGFQIFSEM
jgi:hypothetical protein